MDKRLSGLLNDLELKVLFFVNLATVFITYVVHVDIVPADQQQYQLIQVRASTTLLPLQCFLLHMRVNLN